MIVPGFALVCVSHDLQFNHKNVMLEGCKFVRENSATSVELRCRARHNSLACSKNLLMSYLKAGSPGKNRHNLEHS